MSKQIPPLMPYIPVIHKNITKSIILDYIFKGLLTTNSVTLYKVSDDTFEVIQELDSVFKTKQHSKIFDTYTTAYKYYLKLTKEFHI